jgi:type II secretory pathway pseudopilin PulG
MKLTYRHRRNGVAIVWAIVAMAVVTILTSLITSQVLAGRRLADRRQNQLQALWLARSGLELATARMLNQPSGYVGETVAPIPGSQLRIKVTPAVGEPSIFIVVSEALYPAEGKDSVARTMTRRLKRVEENGRTRVEVLPAS